MMQHSDARERVLDAAERLFAERGYTAVTIKDIAQAAGIHHASLYHHAPKGKSELFVEVTERTIQRHQQGIAEAIIRGEHDLRTQLSGIARWMLSQPPIDMIRMVHSDVPALEPSSGEHLLGYAHSAILEPIAEVLEQAQQRGEIIHPNLGNIAGAIFSIIQGLHMLPTAYLDRPRQVMAEELIDLLLVGLHVR
jgi:AcrR family transcriptional regulator